MEVSNAHHHHHHQRMGSKLEDGSSSSRVQQQEQKRRVRPDREQLILRCPRCDSGNTKFCYYNNYSLSQPRYFCKGCRRYWTQGGSLRNVPIGGGCRKNKRPPSKRSPPNPNPNNLLPPPPAPPLLPPLSYDPNELSLAFAGLHGHQHEIMDDQDNNSSSSSGSNTFLVPGLNPSNHAAGFLDILRGGLAADSGISSCGLYYGFGGGVECGGAMMLPFEGGLMSSTEAVTTTTTATTAATTTTSSACGKAMMMDGTDQLQEEGGLLRQWPVVGGGDDGAAAAATGSLAVDPVLRGDYWNGVGSSWHGLINNSLM